MSTPAKAQKNQEKEAERLCKERDERCVPVVDKVFELLDRLKPSVNPQDKGKFKDAYTEATAETLQLLQNADVTITDVKYIEQLCKTRLEMLFGTVDHSINMSGDMVIEKALGKEYNDMTLNDLDNWLKK